MDGMSGKQETIFLLLKLFQWLKKIILRLWRIKAYGFVCVCMCTFKAHLILKFPRSVSWKHLHCFTRLCQTTMICHWNKFGFVLIYRGGEHTTWGTVEPCSHRVLRESMKGTRIALDSEKTHCRTWSGSHSSQL
jgi:hypothetical protein